MRMKKRMMITFLLSFILAIVAACGATDDVTNEDTDPVETEETESTNETEDATDSSDDGVYTVAIDHSNAPFEYVNEDTGELEGFDVDIIHALAEEAGVELQIEQVDFAGLIAGVSSGKFDIGIGGITITEERKENIDRSEERRVVNKYKRSI